MRAVLVGIGKDNYLIVPKPRYIEVFAYAGAESRDYGTDFFVLQNVLYALFFGVHGLAAKR